MAEGALTEGPLRAGSPLRTPRAASVAGIIFSVLMITALALLRISAPAHPGAGGQWLTDSGRRAAVAVALNLVPFAGIAFLWFVGVLRDRQGEIGNPADQRDKDRDDDRENRPVDKKVRQLHRVRPP